MPHYENEQDWLDDYGKKMEMEAKIDELQTIIQDLNEDIKHLKWEVSDLSKQIKISSKMVDLILDHYDAGIGAHNIWAHRAVKFLGLQPKGR